MAYEIIWSPRAADDLVQIIEYVSVDNPTAARNLAQRIVEHVEHLTDWPLMGHVYRRTTNRTIRELTEPPYRIFYRVDEPNRRVVILTLWHGARRTPRL